MDKTFKNKSRNIPEDMIEVDEENKLNHQQLKDKYMKIEEMLNKVHCADCLEFMKDISDKSIDLTVTFHRMII